MQISASSNYVYVFCFLNSNTHPNTSLYMVNNQVLQRCKGTCYVQRRRSLIHAADDAGRLACHAVLFSK